MHQHMGVTAVLRHCRDDSHSAHTVMVNIDCQLDLEINLWVCLQRSF